MIVILPDTGSRYLSKAFDDDWMRENGFLDRAWIDIRAWDVYMAKSDPHLISAKPTDLMVDVVALFKQYNISQVPVIDEIGSLQGLVTEVALLDHMLRTGAIHAAENTIEDIIDPDVSTVKPNAPLESLMDIFTSQSVALIVAGDRVEGILTKIDILDFLSTQVN
jgi:cystathionine beta-synthase